jgi:hypothetical protein
VKGSTTVQQRDLLYVDREKYCFKEENMIVRSGIAHDQFGRAVIEPELEAARKALDGRPMYLFWTLFNGEYPGVVWSYREAEKDFGQPQPRSSNPMYQRAWRQSTCSTSAFRLLGLAARKYGWDGMMKRYGLPKWIEPRLKREVDQEMGSPRSVMLGRDGRLTMRESMEHDPGTRVGTGSVAGYRCAIYEYRRVFRNNSVMQTRLWAEDRTGLVLKKECRMARGATPFSEPPPNPNDRLTPALRRDVAAQMAESFVHGQDFEVKELKFYERLPAKLFEIPPGTVVEVTGLMRDVGVKLPRGVVEAPKLTEQGHLSSGVNLGFFGQPGGFGGNIGAMFARPHPARRAQ